MAIKIMPGEYRGSGFKKDESFLGLLEPKANAILTGTIGLLILSLGLWSGLWWYKDDLTQKTILTANQITNLQAQRDVQVEETLIELDKTIKSLDEVLKDRIYPANIFSVLEDLVLPEVFYSSFNSEIPEAVVGIHVIAENYRVLAEQMIVFKESQKIKEVEFSSINLDDQGYASADFNIQMDPGLLKQTILSGL